MQETQEIRVRSQDGEDPLEEEMATLSILAWKTPWTEEPADFSPWGHKESDVRVAAQHYAPGLPVPDHGWGVWGHRAGFWETVQESVHLLAWNRPQSNRMAALDSESHKALSVILHA